MKILVTGAAGYLGGAILHEAMTKGYQIKALLRSPEKQTGLSETIDVCQGDLLDEPSLVRAAEGCDAVIHSAALVSVWQRNPDDFHRINVRGTENLLRAAKETGVKRVVYTSSFFALGPTGELPADESWSNCGSYPPTLYARSKTEAQERVLAWAQQGNDVVLVYPVLIYGPGKDTQGNHISKMISDYLQRRIPGIPGDGKKRWTYSFIEDVAKGHLLALEKGKAGEKYILGGEDATLHELFELLESITHIKRPRRGIPLSLLKCLGWIEERRAYFSRDYVPRITREVVEVYKQNWRYSSQKAITQLGYIRTPLKVGLLKTLESLGFTPPEPDRTIL